MNGVFLAEAQVKRRLPGSNLWTFNEIAEFTRLYHARLNDAAVAPANIRATGVRTTARRELDVGIDPAVPLSCSASSWMRTSLTPTLLGSSAQRD
jgi:hypothetical protein